MIKRRHATISVAVIGVLAMLPVSPVAMASSAGIEGLDTLLTKVAPDVRENIYQGHTAFRGELITPATVPVTVAQPITTHGGGTDISLWLPETAATSQISVSGAKVTAFDHGNGATSVPLVKDDGSVQILTIVESSSAPTDYSYMIDAHERMVMSIDDGGAVHVNGADGHFIGGVAPAWAVDANGSPVPTHYEVSGAVLTQVVDHRQGKYVYPIVADPWLGQDLYYQPWVSSAPQGYKVNVIPRAWGQQWAGIATWFAHRDEVVTKLGSQSWRWTTSIQEQFYCHIAGLPASLPTYNLDSWRPMVYWETSLLLYRCNPYDGAWS